MENVEARSAWQRRHDEWIITQYELDRACRMLEEGIIIREIKVHQFNPSRRARFQRMDVRRLLSLLENYPLLENLDFVGIELGGDDDDDDDDNEEDDEYQNGQHETLPLPMEQITTILQNPSNRLKRLRLLRDQMHSRDIVSLGNAIAVNQTLEELDLSHNYRIDATGIASLAAAVMRDQGTVTKLNMAAVELGDDGCRALAQAIHDHSSSSLEELSLSGCGIQDIRLLARAIKESSNLKSLDLSDNLISDSSSLAILLESASLVALDLRQNEIGDCDGNHQGVVHMLHALSHNTTLKQWNVWFNPMTPQFLGRILESLRYNTTLCELSLPTFSMDDMALVQRVAFWVDMNRAGRGWLRITDGPCGVLPYLYARVSCNHNLLYGLLREVPHLWI